DIAEACARLASAKLRCERLAVGDDGQGDTGEVFGTDPPAGRRIEQGTAVKVRYRGPIAVASYAGRPIDDVCASLAQQRLRCQKRSLGPTDVADKAGLVVEQDPAPGQPVESGATITLSFHDTVTVPAGLQGMPIGDACARVQAAGFTCTPNDLGSAAGTGQQPGAVVTVEPGQGTNAAPRSAVTLSAYNADGQPVPAVTGMDLGTACAQIEQAGYVCDKRADRPWRTPNVIASQDQAPGTVQGIGTPVVVHYYDIGPQVLRRWKASGEAVWVLTADPSRPLAPGYVEEGPVGVAFSPFTGGPGLVPLVSWECPPGADCGGHKLAHFYAPAGATGPPGWRAGGYAAHVVAANGGACDSAAGLVPLHRLVRTSKGTTDFAYAASHGELGYYQGIEFTRQAVLGCVWTQ
ncbi:MAG TPA: PASTA domain-containing protein, partial [Cryptosporangiaceae bacterium]|nr:PASTA domain-containing protein [Cryptosporangiaceae bacterium]